MKVLVLPIIGLALSFWRGPVTIAPAPSCFATAASLTPVSWRAAARPSQPMPTPDLTLVREIPLPGPANRFVYQSFDPVTRRIYINHMNAGRTLVFDTDSDRVVTEIMDLARATGVRTVPPHHQVYVSAAGTHEVAIIDDRTLQVTARVGGIRFLDGIAYAPETDKVFVSDESGESDVVIDAETGMKRSTIALGGEAGNTQYDSVSALHPCRSADQAANDRDRSGVLSAFRLDGNTLTPAGELRIAHAHTVSVDPRTHRVYLPLENIDGKPVLHIYMPKS